MRFTMHRHASNESEKASCLYEFLCVCLSGVEKRIRERKEYVRPRNKIGWSVLLRSKEGKQKGKSREKGVQKHTQRDRIL